MQEVAGLSVEPCQGETIIITVFDIKKSEVLFFVTYAVKTFANASNSIISHQSSLYQFVLLVLKISSQLSTW